MFSIRNCSVPVNRFCKIFCGTARKRKIQAAKEKAQSRILRKAQQDAAFPVYYVLPPEKERCRPQKKRTQSRFLRKTQQDATFHVKVLRTSKTEFLRKHKRFYSMPAGVCYNELIMAAAKAQEIAAAGLKRNRPFWPGEEYKMPENLKRFSQGRQGGLLAAEILSAAALALAGILFAVLCVGAPYEGHTVKLGLFLIAAAALAGLVWGLMITARHKAQTEFTCRLYGEAQLAAIDAEVAAGGNYYKWLGIAVTPSSLLSHGAGLVIVPLDDIVNITCRTGGGKARLVLRGHAGGETLLPRFQLNQKARADLHDFTARLSARNPDLTAGDAGAPANGQPADMLPGFFATDTAAGIQMQPDVLGPGGTLQKPSYGKGLLGAVLGAAIGCAAWGFVGLMGYMSGWIGLLVVILAMRGFKLLAGRLDKAGAWISLAVALVMILPANYLVYAALVADALAESYYVTLFDVLPELFSVLAGADLLGQFWLEYGIGAGLTLIFGIFEITSLSHTTMRPGGVTAAPAGVPASGAAAPGQVCCGSVNPAYMQPGTPAASADTGRFEVRYLRKNAKASLITLMVLGILMILLGLLFAVPAAIDGDTTGAGLLLLFFAGMGALYIWLGYYTYCRLTRFVITYDTQNITLTKPNGKTFTCPWTQVTALHLSMTSALWMGYCIDTPQGKIRFNGQMPGWDHLMNFARTYAVNAYQ
jgi:hypothetical protein